MRVWFAVNVTVILLGAALLVYLQRPGVIKTARRNAVITHLAGLVGLAVLSQAVLLFVGLWRWAL